jgi:hypothetical protein
MAFSRAFIECSEPSNGTKIFSNKAIHLLNQLYLLYGYSSSGDIAFASTLALGNT